MGGSTDLTVNFVKNFRLHLDKTAPAAVLPSGLITYTLAISNSQSFSGIENVILTDTIPAGTEFISADPPYTLSEDILTWTLDYLPHEVTWQTQFVVHVPKTTTLSMILNENYGVQGDHALRVPGIPVTTIIELLATATPTPTPTPTSTPTATVTPSQTPTPSEYQVYLPLLFGGGSAAEGSAAGPIGLSILVIPVLGFALLILRQGILWKKMS